MTGIKSSKSPSNKEKRNQFLFLMIAPIFFGCATFIPFISIYFGRGEELMLTLAIVFGSVFGGLIIACMFPVLYYHSRFKKNPELEPVKPITHPSQLTLEAKKLITILTIYPKIRLDVLAEKIGYSVKEVEEKLLELKMHGFVKGHIDPGTNEFISGMVDKTTETVIDDSPTTPDAYFCPYCGASMDSVPVKGTSTKCDNCGNLIVV